MASAEAREELEKVSTGKLKRWLVSKSVDIGGCLEKADLIERALSQSSLPLSELFGSENQPPKSEKPEPETKTKETKRQAKGSDAGKKAKKPKKADPKDFPEAVDGNLYDLEKDWKYFAPGLIFKSYGVGKDERRDKIAAFDLDGTIIRTKSGQDFAKGATDWCQFNAKVFTKLEKFHKDGYRVVIFSNQGGIKAKIKGPKSVQLRDKVDMIAYKRETTAQDGSQPLRFPFLVFFAPKEDEYRKPDQGMFQYFLENFQGGAGAKIDRKASFYCGDMAGRDGDKGDSDKLFAAKIGLEFKTPEDIFGPSGAKAAMAQRAEGEANLNEGTCEILLKISGKLFENGDKFKAVGYKKAAATLKNCPNKVETKKEAMKLPGIGKSIGEKVEEFVKTGKIKFAEELLGLSTETKEQAEKEAKEKEQGMAFAFMD